MARFKVELPTELLKEFQSLEKNTEKMLGEMTKAGAEVVLENVKAKVPLPKMASYVKLTKTYKTPSDDGINTKVYFSGYLPFSNPNRKYFSRKNSRGTVYKETEGVAVDFLANVYEYGRSSAPFPKKPFFRKSFNKAQITSAMEKVQKKYLPKE
jgi:hypothetical protein